MTDATEEPRTSLTSISSMAGFAKVLSFPTQYNQSKIKNKKSQTTSVKQFNICKNQSHTWNHRATKIKHMTAKCIQI